MTRRLPSLRPSALKQTTISFLLLLLTVTVSAPGAMALEELQLKHEHHGSGHQFDPPIDGDDDQPTIADRTGRRVVLSLGEAWDTGNGHENSSSELSSYNFVKRIFTRGRAVVRTVIKLLP